MRAAEEEFLAVPYHRVTISGVAERARVPVGTALVVFADSEEIFLAVVNERLQRWSDGVVAALAARERVEVAALAPLLAASIAGDAALPRLLSLLPGAIEAVRDPSVLVTLTTRGAQCLRSVQEAIARACPDLPAGRAAVLPLYLFVLTSGLSPLARPAAGMAAALADTDLAGLGLDLETELASLLGRWLA